MLKQFSRKSNIIRSYHICELRWRTHLPRSAPANGESHNKKDQYIAIVAPIDFNTLQRLLADAICASHTDTEKKTVFGSNVSFNLFLKNIQK